MLNTISDAERERRPTPSPTNTLERPPSTSSRFGSATMVALCAVALSALFPEEVSAQHNASPPADAVPPATTAPPPPAPVSSAAASWQKSLVARLVRLQRYPPRAHDVEGVVSLAFSINRRGNVVSSHIVKSSGSALLDYEALDLFRRAAPLPAPPVEIADNDLSLIVPIRFAAGGRP
jgi:TonB family protein